MDRELHAYVQTRMPVLARVIGGDELDSIVSDAVSAWPSLRLARCKRGSRCEADLMREVARRVQSRQSHGFVWMWVLSSVIGAVVRAILDWWLSRPENQTKMMVWKAEMRGHDEQR